MAAQSDRSALPFANSPGRPKVSCTECQRRKQKCSREWPCNQCNQRKIPHLCLFQLKPAAGAKRDAEHLAGEERSSSTSSASGSTSSDQSDNGLADWGYLGGQQHLNIENVLPEPRPDSTGSSASHTSSGPSKEVEAAIKILPPRSLTDALVGNFLASYNFRYYGIDPLRFNDEYKEWWKRRNQRLPLCHDFTCLILRVCASSTQHIGEEMQEQLTYELGEGVLELSARYNGAANKLSKNRPAGLPNFSRIQELFHAACWLKSDGQCSKLWQVLCQAIHDAQEIGLHKKIPLIPVSDYDLEVGRRLWVLLYVWDCQISGLLNRPLIIDPKVCTFIMPTLFLETATGAPCPFEHMALMAKLTVLLNSKYFMNGLNLGPDEATALCIEVKEWLNTQSPVFAVNNPDTRWDAEHKWLVLQRYQLHCVAYMFMLMPLKPYVTDKADASIPPDQIRRIRALGIDNLLLMMEATEAFYNVEFPISANFHFVIFCLFDVGVFLCSALIHDRDGDLPRRDRVLETIDQAMDLLERAAPYTNSATYSLRFLRKLRAKLPSPDVQHLNTRQAKRVRWDLGSLDPTSVAADVGMVSSFTNGSDPASSVPELRWVDPLASLDDWPFLIPAGTDSVGDSGMTMSAPAYTVANLGVMGSIVRHEGLNLADVLGSNPDLGQDQVPDVFTGFTGL